MYVRRPETYHLSPWCHPSGDEPLAVHEYYEYVRLEPMVFGETMLLAAWYGGHWYVHADGLARHAIQEYRAGRTRRLTEIAREERIDLDGEGTELAA